MDELIVAVRDAMFTIFYGLLWVRYFLLFHLFYFIFHYCIYCVNLRWFTVSQILKSVASLKQSWCPEFGHWMLIKLFFVCYTQAHLLSSQTVLFTSVVVLTHICILGLGLSPKLNGLKKSWHAFSCHFGLYSVLPRNQCSLQPFCCDALSYFCLFLIGVC